MRWRGGGDAAVSLNSAWGVETREGDLIPDSDAVVGF
jgi:hypothetical protein